MTWIQIITLILKIFVGLLALASFLLIPFFIGALMGLNDTKNI